MDEFAERRIIAGLIISPDYTRQVQGFLDVSFFESPELGRIAAWALQHWQKYQRVADRDIESIFMEELRTGRVSRDEGELIEEILQRLSDDYGRADQFNAGYLFDQTTGWVREQHLKRHEQQVRDLLDDGQVREAEELQSAFQPVLVGTSRGLELGSPESLEAVRRTFTNKLQRVLTYPGAFGNMVNDHLVRGGFVAFLGPEKRGKSFFLLEFGMRAIRQRSNVALFEAGDMTESQVLRRICLYLARRSDRHGDAYLRPVGDCILNQLDLCQRSDRNCDHGIWDLEKSEYYQNRGDYEAFETLAGMVRQQEQYRACDSATCGERLGTVWLDKRPATKLLGASSAQRVLKKFMEKYKRRFKLITYPSGTLTVTEIKSCLDEWEKQDGFVADVILVDYPDLMDSSVKEFRHRQDDIWKGLRGLSQERHALVSTVTQADATSYKASRLAMSNFSEDKRKYAHVTAMWGLNQDPQGREKRLGIMRINELVVRDEGFSVDNEVRVLQDLRVAHAFLESY